MAGIAALAFAYVMSQFYRSFMAVMTPTLSAELGMTNNQLSQALGAWFLTFALCQFIVGPLLDRFGPKLTGGLVFGLFAGSGTALFAISSAPWMVIAAMGLIGVGCSPVLMATFVIFRREYSPAQFATMSAFFIAFGNAGNLLGSSPLALAEQAYGWRIVVWGLFAVTAVIALGVLALVRNPPKLETGGQGAGSYRELLMMKPLWFIFPITAMSYAVIANMRGLWSGPYFDQVHNLDPASIGNLTFYVAIAMVVGSIVYGPLDRVLNSRKWVVFSGAAIMVFVLGLWVADPVASVSRTTWFLIILGLCGVSYPVIMAHGLAFVPARMTGRGATLLNFFSIGGAGAMQSVSGFVYDANAVPDVPVSGFNAVFWLYLGVLIVALVIYFFATDAKPDQVASS